MNHVGALIWQLLPEGALDIDALCLAVHEQFPDEALDQIRQDVVELLKELEQNDLLASVESIAS
jgi:hypothetical protein